MFMGKELHYPTPMLYCPPPTYNSHPCYLKLRGGTKRNETNELTDRTHARFVSFIVLDNAVMRRDKPILRRYFAGVSWTDVYNRCLCPPIVPNVTGEADTR